MLTQKRKNLFYLIDKNPLEVVRILKKEPKTLEAMKSLAISGQGLFCFALKSQNKELIKFLLENDFKLESKFKHKKYHTYSNFEYYIKDKLNFNTYSNKIYPVETIKKEIENNGKKIEGYNKEINDINNIDDYIGELDKLKVKNFNYDIKNILGKAIIELNIHKNVLDLKKTINILIEFNYNFDYKTSLQLLEIFTKIADNEMIEYFLDKIEKNYSLLVKKEFINSRFIEAAINLNDRQTYKRLCNINNFFISNSHGNSDSNNLTYAVRNNKQNIIQLFLDDYFDQWDKLKSFNTWNRKKYHYVTDLLEKLENYKKFINLNKDKIFIDIISQMAEDSNFFKKVIEDQEKVEFFNNLDNNFYKLIFEKIYDSPVIHGNFLQIIFENYFLLTEEKENKFLKMFDIYLDILINKKEKPIFIYHSLLSSLNNLQRNNKISYADNKIANKITTILTGIKNNKISMNQEISDNFLNAIPRLSYWSSEETKTKQELFAYFSIMLDNQIFNDEENITKFKIIEYFLGNNNRNNIGFFKNAINNNKILLDILFNNSIYTKINDQGKNILHLLYDSNFIDELNISNENNKILLNQLDYNNKTPIHYLISNNAKSENFKLESLINGIEDGYDIEKHYETLIKLAVSHQNSSVFNYLLGLKSPDVNLQYQLWQSSNSITMYDLFLKNNFVFDEKVIENKINEIKFNSGQSCYMAIDYLLKNKINFQPENYKELLINLIKDKKFAISYILVEHYPQLAKFKGPSGKKAFEYLFKRIGIIKKFEAQKTTQPYSDYLMGGDLLYKLIEVSDVNDKIFDYYKKELSFNDPIFLRLAEGRNVELVSQPINIKNKFKL